MILKDEIRKIIQSQRNDIQNRNPGTIRQEITKIKPELHFAFIISGIRRCGKSTLLLQSMNREKNYYYLNFEDPRLTEFSISSMDILEEAFFQEYGSSELYYFDEIQGLPGWESYIRYLLDKNKRIIITGSNASLLSKELGTKLTGRNLRLELFPFSYQEYLEYLGIPDSYGSFEQYLISGGFPEFLRLQSEEVLQNLLIDIIARDIVLRHAIKNPTIITDIALYLLSNIGKEYSLTKLQKTFSSIGSVTTITSYVDYLEDAYILFSVPRFSYSHKSRQINPKKIYAIDNGFVYANTTAFTEDSGRLLENHVYLELRKKYREIFYFREKHECDFLVKVKTQISLAIQVCYELSTRNQDREIKGLLEAMAMFNLDRGYILTANQEDSLTIDGKVISIIPARKFSYQ